MQDAMWWEWCRMMRRRQVAMLAKWYPPSILFCNRFEYFRTFLFWNIFESNTQIICLPWESLKDDATISWKFHENIFFSQSLPPYPTEFLWRRVRCFSSFPLGIELKGQGIVLRGQGIELNSHFHSSTIPLLPGAFPLGIELNSNFVPWAQGTGIEHNSQWKLSLKHPEC